MVDPGRTPYGSAEACVRAADPAGAEPASGARRRAASEWRTTARQSIATLSPAGGPALLVIDAARVATGVALDEGEQIVGRSSRCDVWLQDPAVSRRHCRLRLDGATVWISDLDSTNGTWVNGHRVERRALAFGDVISVGGSRLALVPRDSPEWQAHRLLAQQAFGDDLTGLLNRRGFRLRVDAAFALCDASSTMAVLAIDADRFKSLNDEHGHDAGDRALQQIGSTLRALLPDSGIAGRVGGEEFAVLLPRTTAEAALRLARSVCRHLAAHPLHTTRGPIAVTVSIGVAAGAVAAGARPLFAQADAALYRAKAAGRNQVSD